MDYVNFKSYLAVADHLMDLIKDEPAFLGLTIEMLTDHKERAEKKKDEEAPLNVLTAPGVKMWTQGTDSYRWHWRDDSTSSPISLCGRTYHQYTWEGEESPVRSNKVGFTTPASHSECNNCRRVKSRQRW